MRMRVILAYRLAPHGEPPHVVLECQSDFLAVGGVKDPTVGCVAFGAYFELDVIPSFQKHCQRHDGVCCLCRDNVLALNADKIALLILGDDGKDGVYELGFARISCNASKFDAGPFPARLGGCLACLRYPGQRLECSARTLDQEQLAERCAWI